MGNWVSSGGDWGLINLETQPILKVGMHVGPCIVITLNGHLDYFGKTVNATARLSVLDEPFDLHRPVIPSSTAVTVSIPASPA